MTFVIHSSPSTFSYLRADCVTEAQLPPYDEQLALADTDLAVRVLLDWLHFTHHLPTCTSHEMDLAALSVSTMTFQLDILLEATRYCRVLRDVVRFSHTQ